MFACDEWMIQYGSFMFTITWNGRKRIYMREEENISGVVRSQGQKRLYLHNVDLAI
jgi:hypothetical protein